MMPLSLDKRQLCDIQGRLFELAHAKGLDGPAFVRAFMNSRAAAALDDTYDRLQWAGEEYILEELESETGGLPPRSELAEASGIPPRGELAEGDKDAEATPTKHSPDYSREIMYWMGYVYRYWHYYTGETSAQIFATASDKDMAQGWLGLHALDTQMAIDRLKEAKADF